MAKATEESEETKQELLDQVPEDWSQSLETIYSTIGENDQRAQLAQRVTDRLIPILEQAMESENPEEVVSEEILGSEGRPPEDFMIVMKNVYTEPETLDRVLVSKMERMLKKKNDIDVRKSDYSDRFGLAGAPDFEEIKTYIENELVEGAKDPEKAYQEFMIHETQSLSNGEGFREQLRKEYGTAENFGEILRNLDPHPESLKTIYAVLLTLTALGKHRSQ